MADGEQSERKLNPEKASDDLKYLFKSLATCEQKSFKARDPLMKTHNVCHIFPLIRFRSTRPRRITHHCEKTSCEY